MFPLIEFILETGLKVDPLKTKTKTKKETGEDFFTKCPEYNLILITCYPQTLSFCTSKVEWG